MFIDFLTLMLVNMVAALVIHALFMGRWIDKDPKKVIPGYLLTGAIALLTGFRMIFTWPLPGAYNIMYGEMTVLFGGFLFVAGLAVAFGWNLITIGIYAFFAGAVAVLLGVRILDLNLTSEPLAAAGGFAITGVTAILTLPALAFPKLKWLGMVVALVALLSAVVWIIVGGPAYWQHIASFAKWPPGGPK
jgi:putative membrane protein